ncbi:MAG TPA: S8 family serine peptidase [Solirubrobacteraceae bacterium]
MDENRRAVLGGRGPTEPGERFKIQFDSAEALDAALNDEVWPLVRVVNRRRLFLGFGESHEHHLDLSVEMALRSLEENFDGSVSVDRQYALEQDLTPELGAPSATELDGPSLDDVLDTIGATAAHATNRGAGVIIAVVDTGINGAHAEFSNRGPGWAPVGEDPWEDPHGHGTMVACIAGASRAAGGRFNGVAPESCLYPCRTTLVDTELTTIYDHLCDVARDEQRPIVVCNSWGLPQGDPPTLSTDDEFPDALSDAVDAGLCIVFSAGNYHRLAGGDPDECEPTSIWSYKCRDSVLTVGAVDLDGSPWWYSSRGPGQHFGEPGTNAKPDVCGVVPADGEVLYGDSAKRIAHWATSGAAPQAAGLAALMLSTRLLDSSSIFDAIRDTCLASGHGQNCEGAGRIDCAGALHALSALP